MLVMMIFCFVGLLLVKRCKVELEGLEGVVGGEVVVVLLLEGL